MSRRAAGKKKEFGTTGWQNRQSKRLHSRLCFSQHREDEIKMEKR
jgi:hypothetical protein